MPRRSTARNHRGTRALFGGSSTSPETTFVASSASECPLNGRVPYTASHSATQNE